MADKVQVPGPGRLFVEYWELPSVGQRRESLGKDAVDFEQKAGKQR